MEYIYFMIVFFVLGASMGSFFNVVANRLSVGKSIISPGSHCDVCNHELKWFELIPIFSFIFLRGRCRVCKSKISIGNLIVELITGLLYAMAYDIYGLSTEIVIPLIFLSVMVIVIISDIEYMVILDEVLITGSILIVISKLILIGFSGTFYSIVYGILSFLIMYSVKLLGDVSFKKESLGGGDIKLLFFFGLTFGVQMSIVSIFVGTFLAFPVSLYILIKRKNNMIPFGPFLAIGAIIVLIFQLDFPKIVSILMSN